MGIWRATTLVLALFIPPCLPALALAQSASRVGIVTTLAGQATVTRAALARPPLRFKDEVFVRDRISTAENSVLRDLLAAEVLVTVRELSVLKGTRMIP